MQFLSEKEWQKINEIVDLLREKGMPPSVDLSTYDDEALLVVENPPFSKMDEMFSELRRTSTVTTITYHVNNRRFEIIVRFRKRSW